MRQNRICKPEGGAAAVEFAILLPLVLMLIFGMFSGALGWHKRQSLTHAAREAARYGAIQPIDASDTTAAEAALADIAARAKSTGFGEIDAATFVCVSYSDEVTVVSYREGTGSTTTGNCSPDLVTTDFGPHLQLRLEKPFAFNAVLFQKEITLGAEAVTVHEAHE